MSDDLLNQLLTARGIITPEAREKFLQPNYARDIYDPFLLLGMEKAVTRILDAIKQNEKIIVFADYDADGVPGAVILTEFFRKINFVNFEVYIPNRHTEDYGLMSESVREFAKNGAQLIITIDCGISNVEEVALAGELGVDVIITDHHLPPSPSADGLPPAFAVINPKQPGDNYPDKMLCGAAVAFKLVQGLVIMADQQNFRVFTPEGPYADKNSAGQPSVFGSNWEKTLLDLVAIATISDRVPLVDENRALAAFGLMILRRTPRAGLNALFATARLRREGLNEDDIGFMLGPRINSAGRMSHASEAYFLLTTNNPAEAQAMAERLEKQNGERKKSVEQILKTVDGRLGSDLGIIIVGDASWSPGVLGLAASKMVEKFGRPVFVWGGNGNDEIKGSCRSDGTINVVDLMKAAGVGFFTNFGGHAMAGGFSLPSGKTEELEKRLIDAHEQIPKLEPAGAIKPDAIISVDEINDHAWRLIEQLAPFGAGNPKPLFRFPNLEIHRAKTFGNLPAGRQVAPHLELSFKQTDGNIICAIGFFMNSDRSVGAPNKFKNVILESGARIDLLATLEKSYFRREPELRLRIVDIARS